MLSKNLFQYIYMHVDQKYSDMACYSIKTSETSLGIWFWVTDVSYGTGRINTCQQTNKVKE